jgi:hypothetical protein
VELNRTRTEQTWQGEENYLSMCLESCTLPNNPFFLETLGCMDYLVNDSDKLVRTQGRSVFVQKFQQTVVVYHINSWMVVHSPAQSQWISARRHHNRRTDVAFPSVAALLQKLMMERCPRLLDGQALVSRLVLPI